ncbi:hypothetical protein [Sphingopyxis indica]|uniref:Uncharacterized protein n=1 Tax=Sphingopyxis indica TaxID=436663 RepID=A0A239DRS1_9SPHN|nr:hypothetical protein [Sphingopyxis indica]SNS34821.1 hypothetical protein SAMN06295955_101398 [Sphingopyxis indica]
MGEPKPLASLSAGLLARKGGARPAMRRQPLGSGPGPLAGAGYDDLGWNDMGYDVDPDQSEPAHLVDLKPLMPGSVLAHNLSAEQAVDDSFEPELAHDVTEAEPVAAREEPFVSEAPPVPEVVRQQESLIDRVAAVAREVERRPVQKAKAPRSVRAREKAAFTLRLDAERHLRLRLASAVTGRSAQHILTDLLDDYLAALPEIDAMASRLPATRPVRHAAKG